jgi:hypothetical protein
MLTGTVQLKALICGALKREGNPAGNPLPKWCGALLYIDLQS